MKPMVGAAAPTMGIRFEDEQPCKGWINAAPNHDTRLTQPFQGGLGTTPTQGSSFLATLGYRTSILSGWKRKLRYFHFPYARDIGVIFSVNRS